MSQATNPTDDSTADDLSAFMDEHKIYDADLHQTLTEKSLDLVALRAIKTEEIDTVIKEFAFPVKQKMRFKQLMDRIQKADAPKIDAKMNVMLIGDSGSGKTSLLYKYCKNEFIENLASTPAPTSSDRLAEGTFVETLADDRNIEIVVWDTAGQEKWQSVSRQYYTKGDCIVFCYDMSKKDPFENEEYWRKAIDENARNDVVALMVGCKYDLAIANRMYSRNKLLADSLLKNTVWTKYGTVHNECSAKTGHNVSEVFVLAAELVVQTRRDREESAARAAAEAAAVNLEKNTAQKAKTSNSWCLI